MNVKIVNLKGIKRVIFGEMVNKVNIDYTQSLSALKTDLDYALPLLLEASKPKGTFAFMKKE